MMLETNAATTPAAGPDREGRGRAVARWGLVLFFGTAGVAHFLVTDAMAAITPGWVPHPRLVVQATGLCELAGAAGLLTPRWRRAAGWALAAYAVCVFPANVKHAIHDLGAGTGLGWWYHGPRLLLQPAIVWWCLWGSGAVGRKRPPVTPEPVPSGGKPVVAHREP